MPRMLLPFWNKHSYKSTPQPRRSSITRPQFIEDDVLYAAMSKGRLTLKQCRVIEKSLVESGVLVREQSVPLSRSVRFKDERDSELEHFLGQ